MKYTVKNEEIQELNGCESIKFPKYTSQLINWANQNAQGTRPKVVGQLSDLFPEYQEQTERISLDSWAAFGITQNTQMPLTRRLCASMSK